MDVRTTRLREDIETNGEFGAVPVEEGRGRTVLTGTAADREAREYLIERLRDAGLDVRVDAVGNVVGRWVPASADPDAAPVAAGSHLDSVPEGGIFDGPLGVYAALEAVRAMQDADVEPDRPVEVVSFTEEEGQRFDGGLVGSSVAAGDLSVEEALAFEDDGVSLEAALDGIDARGEGRVDAGDWRAWFELHVEQAERLERAGAPAGVVTTITGLSRCEVEIRGEADHAGSTAMDERSDALAAASEFVLDVESAANDVVAAESDTAVATVGKLDVRPNAPNVIADAVELTIDVRDVRHDSVHRIVDEARASLDRLEAERGVETSLDRPWDRAPVPMSERCRDALHEAGASAGIETLDLHSGAAHDTMHVANATDAALLFAPSENGVSHNPLEWTDWEDCAAATRVLAGAMARLAVE
ncbi:MULTISPECIES: Zn-dependent hydrolase [Halorussus]|uniref:Zn-dependent hydrolase n=1 Tax=Halorussus TaxID=1070314 RepID=UPI000E21A798|nr:MULTISPECIES: Zn-dependent hydrolase [Halorussus]NHN59999.1 Zn-dependent hydrolase [Halorussus sp. JP-T4]